jgi:hypothetical protein
MLVGARSSENGNPDCHLADLAKNSAIPQLLRNAFRLADWAPLHNRSSTNRVDRRQILAHLRETAVRGTPIKPRQPHKTASDRRGLKQSKFRRRRFAT